ncbi:AraC family transcriptional regulator [marine bacterium AO1-C]|nr:AraC family transcriptional regulator [marine bacterium AO1-C]
MKKNVIVPYQYNSLTDIHRMLGLPKPKHPLISFVDNMDGNVDLNRMSSPHTSTFYKISYKAKLQGKLRYGQHYYDFDEGGLFFVSPNQLVADADNNKDHTGYTILFHPDFLLSYPLAKKIKQYGFFAYTANEALYLSEQEKMTILSVLKITKEEINSRIDDFSQDVIISQIDLLLNYSNRFYKRQFITRKFVHNRLLQQLEETLTNYFTDEKPLNHGLPTVQYLSSQLNVSPSYLSDMLRTMTGQNTQQHIHHYLIEKAKEKLSTTQLSVSEIAYHLGFEHPQSFSKLFKSKTHLTPLKFRQRFN